MIFANKRVKGFGVPVLGASDKGSFVRIKQCCLFLSFEPGCGVQGKGSLLPRLFKGHLLGLDIYHGGVCIKLITDHDNVGSSDRVLL